jgi:diguanylate cyclase (GGDEF)-like protein
LLSNERAATQTLQSNEKGFRSSQGDQWYSSMREDLAQLDVLAGSLIQLNEQLHIRGEELLEEKTALAAMIPVRVTGVVVAAAPAKKTPLAAAGAIHAPDAAPREGAMDSAVTVAAPVVETRTVTTQNPESRRQRVLVAWISGAVLVLLIGISLATVLSIVRPVGALLNATARLAQGDSAIRVARGGIRELDTLAVAFNAMADQLATAQLATREYQLALETKVAERTHQLQELAERDPLTGLPNRRELFVLLNAAIERARAENYLLGVLFLDVDNFKYINDSMGHEFGDRVLVSLANRLQHTTAGFGYAARLGGDEFTIVFERARSVDDIRAAGLQVVQAFQTPLAVDAS